jgi:hypothetical protein
MLFSHPDTAALTAAMQMIISGCPAPMSLITAEGTGEVMFALFLCLLLGHHEFENKINVVHQILPHSARSGLILNRW